MVERARPVKTCTYHCTSCSLHFHSLQAFDRHRQGDHGTNDPERGRHCVHPLDLEGSPLIALSMNGECRNYGPVKRGVTIWTMTENLERTWPEVA